MSNYAVQKLRETVLHGELHNHLDTQWDTMSNYAVQKLRESVLCGELHNHLDTVGHDVKLRCTEA